MKHPHVGEPFHAGTTLCSCTVTGPSSDAMPHASGTDGRPSQNTPAPTATTATAEPASVSAVRPNLRDDRVASIRSWPSGSASAPVEAASIVLVSDEVVIAVSLFLASHDGLSRNHMNERAVDSSQIIWVLRNVGRANGAESTAVADVENHVGCGAYELLKGLWPPSFEFRLLGSSVEPIIAQHPLDAIVTIGRVVLAVRPGPRCGRGPRRSVRGFRRGASGGERCHSDDDDVAR